MQKISVITVCYNSAKTIEDTIRSVVSQDYPNVEYIIIDGGSSDGTMDIINRYRDRIHKLVSEKDKGMYDAINKGIGFASGEIIAILNSDDFYVSSSILSQVMQEFESKGCDSVYCDLQYVDQQDTNRIRRYWKAGTYREGRFFYGWMPPHPAFFLRKKCYDAFGTFTTELKSAADYELMLRMLHVHKITTSYLPLLAVKMRTGGKSNVTISNRIKANREDRKAWELNHIEPRFYTLLLKPLSKLGQFL